MFWRSAKLNCGNYYFGDLCCLFHKYFSKFKSTKHHFVSWFWEQIICRFQLRASDFLLVLRFICANSQMPTIYFSYSIYLNINSHNSQKKITSDRVILIKLRASNSSNIVLLQHSIFCLANKESHRSYNSRKNMFAERHVQKSRVNIGSVLIQNII